MKIICIGRNYADHAAELHDGAELPKEPLFFLKPDTALLRNNDPFYIPSFSQEVLTSVLPHVATRRWDSALTSRLVTSSVRP